MKTRRTQASIHKPNIRIIRNIIIFLLIIVATAIVLVNKKPENAQATTVEDYLKEGKEDVVNNDNPLDNSKNKASPEEKNNVRKDENKLAVNNAANFSIHIPEESKMTEGNKSKNINIGPQKTTLEDLREKNVSNKSFNQDKNKQQQLTQTKTDTKKMVNKTAKTVTIHIVKKGETYGKISKKYYGTTRYYNKIAQANKNRLKNSRFLSIGDELIIPFIEKIKTRKHNKNKIEKQIAKTYITRNKGKQVYTRSKGRQVYTIKAKDTLSKISKKFYKTTKYLFVIREANPNIRNINRLSIGDKIVIPSLTQARKRYNRLNSGKIKIHSNKRGSNTAACRIHEVQKGENLHIIAKKFNIQLVELIEANETLLKGDFDKIIEGTKLKIPLVVSND